MRAVSFAIVFVALTAALLGAACGDPESPAPAPVAKAATPAPTSIPAPTSTREPKPTPKPAPTSTPAPTPTPTTIPTPTVPPTPTTIPTPTVPPTPTPVPIEEVNFAGVVASTNVPSQVQVVFSLREQRRHAILLPAERVERSAKVYERGPGTDGWEEIDYTETSFFVHTAEAIDLEVVFALDFTNSMSEARLPDGRSGVDAMLDAFDSALAVLPSAHRVGVVEFHDRNVEPGVLSKLTTDRQSIRDSVAEFAQSDFDPGSSRVWDSLVSGLDLFSTRDQNPHAVRALVFLSDGRDTSSVSQREEAGYYALERGAQLYALGVGDVFQEERLSNVARETGGGYYSARDVSQLQEELQLLVNDLRGQYQLSYITLRRTGSYETRISVALANVEGRTEVGPFDVASFFGPDNRGVIDFDPPSLDRANRRATVFVRARHMPRNIDRIRFKLDASKPIAVELAPRRDGGLLDGWALVGPDAAGYYDASSDEPLEFGNLGLLFKLTVSDVAATADGIEVLVEFDNTIYSAGKSLAHPTHVTLVPSRPSGRIAFASDRDGDYEIYVMNADGSGVTRLTDNSADDWSPSWSPDGRRIGFISGRDGNSEVYVMNADGSGVTRLTDHPDMDTRPPAWSPDGRRMAFVSYRDGNSEVYVMNADGSGVTRLTDHPDIDMRPAWSLGGRRIAFASNRDGDYEIYVMNADGSDVTRLTNHSELDFDPAWSPDGRQIAFYSERDGNREIYVMNADGSGVTRLTDRPVMDWRPTWSPGGRWIAFASGDFEIEDLDIFVMRADGSELIQITDTESFDSSPSWSAGR